MNPELQGREFAPTAPYLVGREKVREFARAVFAANPINHDVDAARAAGHADIVAPPTFAVVVQEHTLAQLLAEPDAGIDFTPQSSRDGRRFLVEVTQGQRAARTSISVVLNWQALMKQ